MSSPPGGSKVLTFQSARHVVEEQAALISAGKFPGGQAQTGLSESEELVAANGRVLAEPVLADRDLPPFARSTRDGYAVRSSDLERVPAKLKVIGEIKAGESTDRIPAQIGKGEAASIMTGAPVPTGADAVVMVEYCSQDGQRVEITRGVLPGENIVPRGAEAIQGSVLVDRGTRLSEPSLALAASAGKSRLLVYSRPRVAVLTTGDEIVEINATPGPTQIRNSNSYSLASQILGAGGQPVLLPIAPDEPEKLRHLIELGLRSDLLLLTGGVSMGRFDLVEQVLGEMQAEFFFTGAKIQPGRPVVFGKCAGENSSGGSYFFGLPGNPVSTMVTFELFVRPMIEALAGQSAKKLAFLHARLKRETRVKTGLTRFLPATLSGEFEHSEIELVAWQGSGDVAATVRANCYAVIPPDRDLISAGEWIAVLLR